MDCLKELLSCKVCQSRLKAPVILPCGKTICNVHIDTTNDEFTCILCSKTHTIPNVVINEAISKALNDNIDRKIFGEKFDNACHQADRLERSIEDFNLVAKNKEEFVHNYFSVLRNKIDQNVEQFRLRFDEAIEWMRDQVDNYENECNLSLKQGVGTVNICSAENEFESGYKFLSSLTLDEKKWEEVAHKLSEKRHHVRWKLIELKKEILLDKQDSFVFDKLDFPTMTMDIAKTFDPFVSEVDQNNGSKLKRNFIKEYVYFQSLSSGKYLGVEDFGKKPILANREHANNWETFYFVEQENSLVGIRSIVNHKFFSLQQNNTIIASHEQIIDTNQKFEICFSILDERIVAIRSAANKKYFLVPENWNDPIVATGYKLSKNSMFRISIF